MEELCQPSLNGRGGPISPIAIQATKFGLKNDMIQQSIKVNGFIDDALRLYLFPHSLTHHATAWFDRLPRNSINTFEQMAKMFLGKYFPPSMVTKLRNEITNFLQHPDESLFKACERFKISIDRCPNHNMLLVTQIDTFYNGLTLRHRDTINAAAGGTFMKGPLKAEMVEINKKFMRVLQVNQQVKVVTPNCETYDGPHSFSDCPATVGQTQTYMLREPIKANDAILKNMQTNMTSLTNSNLELKNMFGQFMKMNSASCLGSITLLVVERETEATKDTVHPTNNGSTEDVQPPVVQNESPILNSEPVVALIVEPVASLGSDPKPNQRPSIPYPSRLHDQKLHDKANDQREKFFKIFKDLNFNISFADALILMPKFGPSIKSLLTNKDKLGELTRTPLNEHCSMVLLKKLPEKLGAPGKFLISYDFPRMTECLALDDLDASINLMPFSMWNKLFLPDLSPTYMNLELSDHLTSHPIGVTEDVFVKRYFLKTRRALIDMFKGELTLRVGKEAITFNLDQTSRYSANYNDMTANQIDVIDMACEEYSLEVIGFSDVIVKVDAFLALEDDPTLPKVDQSYVDTEGDILLLEAFLNDDPLLPLPNQGNYLPHVQKELKICEAKSDKSSIDEPPEVKLKDLPPYLEYAFLEHDDKLPVIITKYLSVEEKAALITVLKSHKRAIAWKLSDIKGIDPEFFTHKILMEEDFEPAVQHQIRVNPKIYDVIKNEVLKLLDAGLIYPIS
nr:reverse transcriptase domain-containing protein [Tanacetum cinerariifolium]